MGRTNDEASALAGETPYLLSATLLVPASNPLCNFDNSSTSSLASNSDLPLDRIGRYLLFLYFFFFATSGGTRIGSR